MKPQGLDKSSNHHPDYTPENYCGSRGITFFDKKIIFETTFLGVSMPIFRRVR
jgi:hypothetical protein